jgi:ornithine decarboxylase
VLRDEYYSDEDWRQIKQFADTQETPFLVVKLDLIKQQYEELKRCFPYAVSHYAVKANPAPVVLELLRDLGSNFDIASIYELDRVLSLGVSPDRVSYGNTIKKAAHVRYAYEKGVRLFVTDSEADLRNIAREAPGSRVFCRILVEGAQTAEWPLSRKFGCHADMAVDLLLLSRELGLEPYGVSFHVGSQQKDIGTWDDAIAMVKAIFDRVAMEGIQLKMINLGGGFPARYAAKVNTLDVYGEEITRYLEQDFGENLPEIILEPGRSMVGNAGVLVSEVVLVSKKAKTALARWVYTDVGLFGGLIETMGEAIKYPIYTEATGEGDEVVLAGPTCDSTDVMYEHAKYQLPVDLKMGDRLYWFSTGAYTNSYSSVEFNGFPPLKVNFIP